MEDRAGVAPGFSVEATRLMPEPIFSVGVVSTDVAFESSRFAFEDSEIDGEGLASHAEIRRIDRGRTRRRLSMKKSYRGLSRRAKFVADLLDLVHPGTCTETDFRRVLKR